MEATITPSPQKGVTLAEPATLTIDADGTTVLSPNLGKLSAGIRPVVRNYMILCCAAKQGLSQIEFRLTKRSPKKSNSAR